MLHGKIVFLLWRLVLTILMIAFLLVVHEPTYAATLELAPATVSIVEGQTTTLDITLDPQGASVVGVDVFLRFDPNNIGLESIESTDVFSSQLGTSINNDNGTAKFSLVNAYDTYQTDDAVIAQIVLRGETPINTTNMTFDFISGRTQDTNVTLSGGRDGLTSVNFATIAVTKNNSSGTTTPSVSPSPSSSTVAVTPTPSGNTAGVVGKNPQNEPPKTKVISPLSDDTKTTNNKGSVLGDEAPLMQLAKAPVNFWPFIYAAIILAAAFLIAMLEKVRNSLLNEKSRGQETYRTKRPLEK